MLEKDENLVIIIGVVLGMIVGYTIGKTTPSW